MLDIEYYIKRGVIHYSNPCWLLSWCQNLLPVGFVRCRNLNSCVGAAGETVVVESLLLVSGGRVLVQDRVVHGWEQYLYLCIEEKNGSPVQRWRAPAVRHQNWERPYIGRFNTPPPATQVQLVSGPADEKTFATPALHGSHPELGLVR